MKNLRLQKAVSAIFEVVIWTTAVYLITTGALTRFEQFKTWYFSYHGRESVNPVWDFISERPLVAILMTALLLLTIVLAAWRVRAAVVKPSQRPLPASIGTIGELLSVPGAFPLNYFGWLALYESTNLIENKITVALLLTIVAPLLLLSDTYCTAKFIKTRFKYRKTFLLCSIAFSSILYGALFSNVSETSNESTLFVMLAPFIFAAFVPISFFIGILIFKSGAADLASGRRS